LAIAVHKALGPGLLESVYEACLIHELTTSGLSFAAQVPVPVRYGPITLECGYRLDLVVENRLIIEVKSVEALAPIHDAQLITYLRLTGIPVGLIINFNVPRLIDGVRRRVITLPRITHARP
jgi:GxxExxY protein